MAFITDVESVHVARLKPEADLVGEVNTFLKENNIEFGMISIIGAFSGATLGAFDFKEGAYRKFRVEGDTEILHCTGNVSKLEGDVFAHLHATLAHEDGSVKGGHVFEGCAIKVAECIVYKFKGEAPERIVDPGSGLKLWKVG